MVCVIGVLRSRTSWSVDWWFSDLYDMCSRFLCRSPVHETQHVHDSRMVMVRWFFAGKFSVASSGTTSCTDCDAGKYSMTSGAMSDSTCSSCPAYANSLSGSDSAEDCTCNAGSSGPNGGTCVLCVAGKYTSQTGSAECIAWPVGTYSTTLGALSSSTCVSCWASSGRYCPSASISPTGSEGPAGYGCLGGTSDKQACSADAGFYL